MSSKLVVGPDTPVIIRVNKLSKMYRMYDRPEDRLKQLLWGRLTHHGYGREFWALRQLSFDVQRGEALGIIGANGSGKSTLLQIIHGTLHATDGNVDVRGRMGAILELGAGFNPDFTGVENARLALSLKDIPRAGMPAALAAAISFADLGAFIDQPVKTYSSGMFVRLAFAVATAVRPDILIVDEALSVGDFAFRNRCMERINAMRMEGTTLLFVSHDFSTLQLLCDRLIWLDKGCIRLSGNPTQVYQEYYAATTGISAQAGEPKAQIIPQQDTGMAEFSRLTIDPPPVGDVYQVGEPLIIRFSARTKQAIPRSIFGISIYSATGEWMIGQSSLEAGLTWDPVPAGGRVEGTLILTPNCLAPGEYRLANALWSEDLSLCLAMTEVTCPFSVRWRHPTWGKFIHPCKWSRGC